jgi:hypothetical protein
MGMKDLEFHLLEYQEHCPTLFSMFSPKMIFKLLTCLLLERSVVFVHENLSLLTSIVLALKLMIRPFQWCYMLVPILPTVLLDCLEMP